VILRIIQVIGHSGSGKTTFILSLIRMLQSKGTIAVIKHLGHHLFRLEEGKDTTLMYDAGADFIVGVDAQKTVLMLHEEKFYPVITFLSESEIDYLIIEGFKSYNFPSIVFGELASEFCVLREPTLELVARNIEKFYFYHTLTSIKRAVVANNKSVENGIIAVCKIVVTGPELQNPDVFLSQPDSRQITGTIKQINQFKEENNISNLVCEFQNDFISNSSAFFFGCHRPSYEDAKGAISSFRQIVSCSYPITEEEERLIAD